MITQLEEQIVEFQMNDREQMLAVMVNFDCTVSGVNKDAYSGHS